jgi:hypothetical protein
MGVLYCTTTLQLQPRSPGRIMTVCIRSRLFPFRRLPPNFPSPRPFRTICQRCLGPRVVGKMKYYERSSPTLQYEIATGAALERMRAKMEK